MIVERSCALSLHKRINQFTSNLEKNLQNTEKPKEFKKIVPIREEIQFFYKEDLRTMDELPLFRISAM